MIVHALNIRAFRAGDAAAVISLWDACGLTRPWNDPQKDIERKLRIDPDWFLVGTIDGEVIASLMVGYDGHRGWVYYFAVKPDLQRGGIGRQMMMRAESMLLERGCPKINLQVRSTNEQVLEFYRRLGYAVDDVVSLGKRLIED